MSANVLDLPLPVFPVDGLVQLDGKETEASNRILESEDTCFTRVLKILVGDANATSINEFPTLQAFLDYHKAELKEVAAAVGAKVVPHTYGLVPNLPAIRGRDGYLSYHYLYQPRKSAERYSNLIPDGFLLASEVAVVEPIDDLSFPSSADWHAVSELHRAYAQEARQEGKYYLNDLSRPGQYVYGTLRANPTEAPALYLTDIDPYMAR